MLDERVFQWFTALPSNQPEKLLPKAFFYISKTGDGYLYAPIAMVLYYLDKEHGNIFVFTALMAYLLEIPIYLAMKHLFKRPRPCDYIQHLTALIIPSDKFSLPSGHTAAAFLMATIVSQFYPSLALVAFIWATLIGISRIVLRVHFPLDVIIGASLGCFIAFVSLSILG